ncbi:transposase domain-containing protein [Roseibium sp. RKSG952]|uniref:transposase domain-containing protein n=1 Tax=Roseibium sp. RKSG952 TaxID=2529384 RepID=UPI0034CFBADA
MRSGNARPGPTSSTDCQAWLTWVLAQISEHNITRLNELMPWCHAALTAQQGFTPSRRPNLPDGHHWRM